MIKDRPKEGCAWGGRWITVLPEGWSADLVKNPKAGATAASNRVYISPSGKQVKKFSDLVELAKKDQPNYVPQCIDKNYAVGQKGLLKVINWEMTDKEGNKKITYDYWVEDGDQLRSLLEKAKPPREFTVAPIAKSDRAKQGKVAKPGDREKELLARKKRYEARLERHPNRKKLQRRLRKINKELALLDRKKRYEARLERHPKRKKLKKELRKINRDLATLRGKRFKTAAVPPLAGPEPALANAAAEPKEKEQAIACPPGTVDVVPADVQVKLKSNPTSKTAVRANLNWRYKDQSIKNLSDLRRLLPNYQPQCVDREEATKAKIVQTIEHTVETKQGPQPSRYEWVREAEAKDAKIEADSARSLQHRSALERLASAIEAFDPVGNWAPKAQAILRGWIDEFQRKGTAQELVEERCRLLLEWNEQLEELDDADLKQLDLTEYQTVSRQWLADCQAAEKAQEGEGFAADEEAEAPTDGAEALENLLGEYRALARVMGTDWALRQLQPRLDEELAELETKRNKLTPKKFAKQQEVITNEVEGTLLKEGRRFADRQLLFEFWPLDSMLAYAGELKAKLDELRDKFKPEAVPLELGHYISDRFFADAVVGKNYYDIVEDEDLRKTLQQELDAFGKRARDDPVKAVEQLWEEAQVWDADIEGRPDEYAKEVDDRIAVELGSETLDAAQKRVQAALAARRKGRVQLE